MYLRRLQHFGHVQIADIRIAADSDPRSTIRSGLQMRRRLEDGRPREKLQLENRCNHEEIEWLCILARWSGVFVLLPSRMSLSLSSYVCLSLSPNSVRYNIVMRLSALRKMHQLFRGKYLLRLSCPACLGMRVMGLNSDKTFPRFNVQTPRCKSSCRKKWLLFA